MVVKKAIKAVISCGNSFKEISVVVVVVVITFVTLKIDEVLIEKEFINRACVEYLNLFYILIGLPSQIKILFRLIS